jgi:hypothetical protein
MTSKRRLHELIMKLESENALGSESPDCEASPILIDSVLQALIQARDARAAGHESVFLQRLNFASYQILDGWPRRGPLGLEIMSYINSETAEST